MSQFFTSGGQSIRVSASASVLPMNIRTDFLYDWLVWSLWSLRDSQESSPIPQFKSINSSVLSFLSHPYMTTGKTIGLTRRTFVGKVMYLLLNRLSRLVVTFLPRSFLKCSICTFKNVYPLTRYRFYMYLLTRHIHRMFKYSFYFLIFIYLIYHLKKQVK